MKAEIESLKSIKNRIKTNGEEMKRLNAKKADFAKKADTISREIELCEHECKEALSLHVRGNMDSAELKNIKAAHKNLLSEEKETQEFLKAIYQAIDELKTEEKSMVSQLAEAEKMLFGLVFVELQEKILSSLGPDGLMRTYAAYCLSGGKYYGKDFLDHLVEPVWKGPYGIYGPDMSFVNSMKKELLNEFIGKKE